MWRCRAKLVWLDNFRLRLYSDTWIAGKLHFLAGFLFCFLRLFKFISGSEYNHRSGLVADSWICVVTRALPFCHILPHPAIPHPSYASHTRISTSCWWQLRRPSFLAYCTATRTQHSLACYPMRGSSWYAFFAPSCCRWFPSRHGQ